MLVHPGALPRASQYAAVPESAVIEALRNLTLGDEMTPHLDAAFRRLETEQAELAAFIGRELAEIEQAEGQALGYFLLVLVYLAFEEAFGRRLHPLEAEDLDRALARLVADGEVRDIACRVGTYSEDAVAVGQPALMALVRAEIDGAVERRTDVDPVMQAVLVEIVALSAAVWDAS